MLLLLTLLLCLLLMWLLRLLHITLVTYELNACAKHVRASDVCGAIVRACMCVCLMQYYGGH